MAMGKNGSLIFSSKASSVHLGKAIVTIAFCHENNAVKIFIIEKCGASIFRRFNGDMLSIQCTYTIRKVHSSWKSLAICSQSLVLCYHSARIGRNLNLQDFHFNFPCFLYFNLSKSKHNDN